MKWRELVPFPSPLDDPRSVLAVKGPLSPCVPVPPALQRCTELKALASLAGVFFYDGCVIGSLRLRLARIASMMRRSCSLRRRSRPPSAQTADTARLSMSAACFMDSSTCPLLDLSAGLACE